MVTAVLALIGVILILISAVSDGPTYGTAERRHSVSLFRLGLGLLFLGWVVLPLLGVR